MGDFRRLEVWQLAKELAVDVYKITDHGEFKRDFELKDQIRRAVVSIASNIKNPARINRAYGFSILPKALSLRFRLRLKLPLRLVTFPKKCGLTSIRNVNSFQRNGVG